MGVVRASGWLWGTLSRRAHEVARRRCARSGVRMTGRRFRSRHTGRRLAWMVLMCCRAFSLSGRHSGMTTSSDDGGSQASGASRFPWLGIGMGYLSSHVTKSRYATLGLVRANHCSLRTGSTHPAKLRYGFRGRRQRGTKVYGQWRVLARVPS